MALLELFVLAVALAMDSTAVAGTRGLAATRVRLRDAALVGFFFGGAQGLMPALGWLLGESIASFVRGWGHWITFSVLVVLGGKMIHEAVGTEEARDPSHPFGLRVLALLSVATSIDALAAGVTLALRGAPIAAACAMIGVVTLLLSMAGVFVGHRFGSRVGRRLDVFGGLVLVGLGVKALVVR